MYVPIKIQQLIFVLCLTATILSNKPSPLQVAEAKSNSSSQILHTWVILSQELPKATSDRESNKKVTIKSWNLKPAIDAQEKPIIMSKELEAAKWLKQSVMSISLKKSQKTDGCPIKIILRKGWNDPRVQYAYNLSCGDMDFIKTIEAESKWDVNALGDHGKSFWLCQIHKGFNAKMQKAYRELKTDNEKVEMCYYQYKDWVRRGVIKTRLYGYNTRDLPQNKNSFTFLE